MKSPVQHESIPLTAIRRFVREDLGCGCPEEVFDDIRIEVAPGELEAGANSRLLVVGGRLMVLIVEPGASNPAMVAVSQLLDRGARLRDDRGCNRFRLVLVHRADQDSSERRLADVARPDERTHLHIVAAARIPDLAVG